jgi:hypothetical protein
VTASDLHRVQREEQRRGERGAVMGREPASYLVDEDGIQRMHRDVHEVKTDDAESRSPVERIARLEHRAHAAA